MSMVFRFRKFLHVSYPHQIINNQVPKGSKLLSSSAKSTSTKRLLSRVTKGLFLASPMAILLLSNEALCANSSSSSSPSSNDDDPVEKIIKQVYPVVAPLGMGGVFGFATAVALKRLGEKFAYVIGISFLGLQSLNYAGYIKIDYLKMNDDAKKIIDANNDGKVDVQDFVMMWRKLKTVLTSSLPSAGGFSAGFAMGLYFA